MSKPIFIFALLCCYSLAVCAQQVSSLRLEKVTVFLDGAQLYSTAKVALAKGENVIVFDNVARETNPNTIAINTTHGVSVLSSTLQQASANAVGEGEHATSIKVTPVLLKMQDTLQQLADSMQIASNRIETLEEQISILQSNREVINGQPAEKPTDVEKMLTYTGQRMAILLKEKRQIKGQFSKLRTRHQQLSDDISVVAAALSTSFITVRLFAPEATTTDISITYLLTTGFAGWEPTYDIAAENNSNILHCFYKANVHQSSGLRWANVKLVLSMGDPTEGMQPQEFNPWLVTIAQPSPIIMSRGNEQSGAFMPDSFDFATVSLDTASPLDGSYHISAQSTANEYVRTINTGVNTEFYIDIPQSIPSDDDKHLIAIKQFDMPASFSYYVAPRSDRDAFRMAKMTDWAKMDLLPGTTNIFFDNQFIGNGVLTPRNTDDTLSISLGRDKKVMVQKETDRERKSVKTFGSNVKEHNSYNITLRNTRAEAITIDVVDQVPVSKHSSITIDDVEAAGADYSENDGKITWKVNLRPNEVRQLHYSYTMKYPRGKTVVAE